MPEWSASTDPVTAAVGLAGSVTGTATALRVSPLTAPPTDLSTRSGPSRQPLRQRRVKRFFDSCVDTVADKLVTLIGEKTETVAGP
jgi:hypothetical protein